GLNAEGAADKFSRKGLDELTEVVKRFKAKGLAWLKVEADKLTGPIEKFLPAPVQQALRQRMQAKAGDLLLIVADTEAVVCQSLDNLRAHMATAVTGVTDWWVRKADLEEQERKELDLARKEKRAPRPTERFEFRPTDFAFAWIVDFPMF